MHHSLLKDPPPGEKNQIDMLIDGGVTAINATVVLDTYKNSFNGVIQEMYQYFVLEETLPDKVIIAKTVRDIEEAKRDHKIAIILGTQGADLFEHDLRYITIFHKLGMRIVQITYNQHNNLGSGCFEPNDTGLTRFGQQSIYEMNRLGILVDLSHVGYRTSMDAIELSNKPCIFSHSGVKKFNSNTRNLMDDQIREVTSKGGVIGLCPHSVMNCKNDGSWPTVDDYIDQIFYVMDIGGEGAAAVGVDRWMRPTLGYMMLRVDFERTLPKFFGGFDGTQKHVNGFNYYDEWENLGSSLLRRGLTDTQTKNVLGGNFLRVFHEVWGD